MLLPSLRKSSSPYKAGKESSQTDSTRDIADLLWAGFLHLIVDLTRLLLLYLNFLKHLDDYYHV